MKLLTRLNLIVAGLTATFVIVLICAEVADTRSSVSEEVEAANRVGSQLLGRLASIYSREGGPELVLQFLQQLGHVRANEGAFLEMLQSLSDLPIVGDVRGMGYFYAIELVRDKETKASFSDEESETLLRGYLSGELFSRGLICRSDDRGDPVVQLAPPLIAGPEQFAEIEAVLRPVLEEAGRRMRLG